MGYSWHSYHRNPDWRRSDRRANGATERMHEALNVSLEGRPTLSADVLARARERRVRYATRNEIPAWASSPPVSWLVAFGAIALGLLIATMAVVALLGVFRVL